MRTHTRNTALVLDLLRAPASGLHSTRNYGTRVLRVQHSGLVSMCVRAFNFYVICTVGAKNTQK